MNKPIIGIDINEIIRGRWQKFDQCYVSEFGMDGVIEPFDTFDFRNHYKFEDVVQTTNFLNEELPEEVSPLEYVVDPKTGEAPVDAFAFRPETESISADAAYKKFLYEDYVFEIFGAAPLLYKNVDVDFERFFKKYKDTFDIRIISKENPLSISSTLFFLSKSRSRYMGYHFFEDNDTIWSMMDCILTTDPELVKSKPENKKVIKFSRQWNEQVTGDLNVTSIVDMLENNDFEKLFQSTEQKLLQ
jgi:hypothetical protein